MDKGKLDWIKAAQNCDQGFALLAEHLPPFFRRMYRNLRKEGFTEEESMDILKVYIQTSFHKGFANA